MKLERIFLLCCLVFTVELGANSLQRIGNSNGPPKYVALVHNNRASSKSTPLIRNKRGVTAALGAIGVALGLSTQAIIIIDTETNGEAFYPSIKTAREGLEATERYLKNNKGRVQVLYDSLINATDDYAIDSAGLRKFMVLQSELSELFNHESVQKAILLLNPHLLQGEMEMIENEIPGLESLRNQALAKSENKDLYIGMNVLYGALNLWSLWSAKNIIKHQNLKISDVVNAAPQRVSASELRAQSGKVPRDLTVSGTPARVPNNHDSRPSPLADADGTQTVLVPDENGVVHEIVTLSKHNQRAEQGKIPPWLAKRNEANARPQVASSSRTGALKAWWSNARNTLKTGKLKFVKNVVKGAFKPQNRHGGSFDPVTGRVKNYKWTGLAAKGLTNAVSLVTIALSGYQIYQTMKARGEQSNELIKEASEWKVIENNVRGYLNPNSGLQKNITLAYSDMDEMALLVQFLFETSSSVRCDITRNNLKPVLSEVLHEKNKLVNNLVRFTQTYDHIKKVIFFFKVLNQTGEDIYANLTQEYPIIPETLVLDLMNQAGLVNFKWNEWKPALGIDGQCNLHCGMYERKMIRTCKTGHCFGVNNAKKMCDGKVYNETLHMTCLNQENDNQLEFSSNLPSICQTYEQRTEYSYFHIVDTTFGLYLSINKTDPHRSLTLLPYTGKENQMWRTWDESDGTLLCKYLYRAIGEIYEKWTLRGDGTIRSEGNEVPFEISIPLKNNEQQVALASKWKKEELRVTTVSTTTTTTTTTTAKPVAHSVEEFLDLIDLSNQLLPKFRELGITLDILPDLTKACCKEDFWNSLGLQNNFLHNMYKEKIAMGVNYYLEP